MTDDIRELIAIDQGVELSDSNYLDEFTKEDAEAYCKQLEELEASKK